MNSGLFAIACCVLSDATPTAVRSAEHGTVSTFTRAEGAPRAGMLHGEARVSSATALVDSLFLSGAASASDQFA
ncbi:MAG: hypothetical protein HZA32_05995 [Opitutae bacterium]|nr:hypothetical protein [Opitutae bacterium]